MNIFHKIALQGLFKSRTRTLVTVAGVALSAAMITAVATFAVSLQTYMVDGAIASHGGWHTMFFDADADFAEEQRQNPKTKAVSTFEELGYAVLEGGQNPDKPYLFLAGFCEDTFGTLPLLVLSGRLPENGDEVLLPAHVAANGGVKFQPGDTLALEIGTRQAGGKTLCQNDPFQAGAETLQPTMSKTYTVVGIYQRPSFEQRSAPGYTLITRADPAVPADRLSVFVTLEKPAQTQAYSKQAADGRAYMLNNNVLRFLGYSDDKLFNMILYSVGSVLILLIMVGSVFMIYNSFHISLNERTHQLGILMSVGATEKQLRNSVLFEGFCIGMLGIPLGILIGLPSIKLVLGLAAQNFANILYSNVPLRLVASPLSLAAAAAVSLLTILISAYIPAKKAASMPVMECIRQTNEIKVDPKDMRTSKHAPQLCGLEGTLARKNFRRNKGRYRSIVLSLTLSVVLFVAVSAFRMDLSMIASQARVVTDYDIGLAVEGIEDAELTELYERLRTVPGITGGRYQAVIQYPAVVRADALSDAFWQETGTLPDGETVELLLNITILDDNTFDQMAAGLGGARPEGTLIACAKMAGTGYVDGPADLADLFSKPSLRFSVLPLNSSGQRFAEGIELHAEAFTFLPPDIPPIAKPLEMNDLYYFEVFAPWSMRETLVPPGAEILGKGMVFQSETPGASTKSIQDVIAGIQLPTTLYNTHAILEENRNMLFIVDLFTTVFLIMISLIAVANVFNTISTNIKLRRRELAMLRSVGMSDRDFDRMMRFECVLYGVKTLLYGVPLSVLASVLIFLGMDYGGSDLPFRFPWGSLAVSILGVFLVIMITMLYAVRQIRKENIIDALRDDLA